MMSEKNAVATKPKKNETVWFWVDSGGRYLRCAGGDADGWHLLSSPVNNFDIKGGK